MDNAKIEKDNDCAHQNEYQTSITVESNSAALA